MSPQVPEKAAHLVDRLVSNDRADRYSPATHIHHAANVAIALQRGFRNGQIDEINTTQSAETPHLRSPTDLPCGDTVTTVTRADNRPSSALPSGFSLQSAAPVLLFLAINRVAGLRWAVAGATAVSIAFAIDRRRKGLPLGKFMPLVTGAVILRGVIGVITGSDTVYFGLGIATKYLVALLLLGSVVAGAPLAKRALPFLMQIPDEMATHRVFHSTMGIVTAIAGLYYAVSASFDIWLFRRSSVEGFVLIRFLANWPLSTVALVAILASLQVRLQRIPGAPPFSALIEARLGGVPESHERN